MPFHARNAYYLRISQKHVLPLYVYLDERHLDWMSDVVLQHVIADLRPRILEKLRMESDNKKSTGGKGAVDTHRGDNYQFCYFLRKTEPHSVIMKNRLFKAAPPQQKVTGPPSVPQPKAAQKSRRRKRAETSPPHSQDPPIEKQRSKRVKPTIPPEGLTMDLPDESDHDDRDAGDYRPSSDSSDEDLIPTNRMAKRKKLKPAKHKRDDPMDEDEADPVQAEPEVTLAVEGDEEKPKPILDLKYRGFTIFGLCLCVVVEPWPHFQYSMAGCAPSIAPVFQRQNETLAGPSSLRQGTPLFLPDDPEQDEITPQTREPRPHPLFSEMTSFDDDEDDNGGGGMMAFSQVLTSTGEYRGGIDDDENMADVLFGDADEQREI
ncbi:hypothetical protein PC9H_004989 [Pleurotus ostreatus]|uniref:Uncharacterized protein n=1 Tax=Pleurotus ostreatus TaxID=5322 RepID=A0A8H7DWL8_PLEOS|nr:uncharacterized protein PC9H_004989 [Pleurotus ostreatus]KAF7433043.1 hypothetical protein PC9H_004989 [Pleurotus ostreatus]KAJ8698345.1 hypothetical protein PTI98_005063 [Pleurotus ostreatus]